MHTDYNSNSAEIDLRERLSTPPSTLPERVPCVGELVQLRSRRWLVEEVVANGTASPLVRLACADDDAQGQSLEVYWDYEIDRRILEEEGWADLATKGKRLEISGTAAAAWLGSLEQVVSSVSNPDFVWSGPKVPGLYSRDTRQVYEELMSTAKQSIWASTYAYFDGPRAFETLARRMDAVPSLEVTLLLNIERRRGDTTAEDHLVRRFADRFWGEDWPGSSRPRVYYDPRSVALEGPPSALHAKAVIADEETVFITSANLTEAALDRNIETGLLLRDRTIAATALSYFQGLIDRGRLRMSCQRT